MKKLFSWLLCSVIMLGTLSPVLPAFAQAQISPSQLQPHWGYGRKAPCGAGAGDNCGSNPPTWHLTPDQCGIMISTGAAKNADGSNSTEGIHYTLPTSAEFAAFGWTAMGAPGSGGTVNRSGQCVFTWVNGNPGPNNAVVICIDGISGADKFTTFAQSAYDLSRGCVPIPFTTSGAISYAWNGNSWIGLGGSGAMMEHVGMGQLNAHGQGRLFKVTADTSWNTVGTLVGKLAYCPNNGRGTIGVGALGGYSLTLMAGWCTFMDNDLSAGADWIGMRNLTSGVISAIAQGAAYGAGTAPNGDAFGAGFYTVIQPLTMVGFVTGNTVEIHNVYTNLGTVLDGKWIGKKLVAGVDPGCPAVTNCIEIHERVDTIGVKGALTVNVKAPSSFVAGDALTQSASYNYSALIPQGTGSSKVTNTLNGTDVTSSSLNTVVGLAVKNVTNGYEDSVTKRGVASLFFPMNKECKVTYSVTRTTASLVSVEPNSEIRCTFAYIQGTTQNNTNIGDPGRAVDWTITAAVSNNTNGDGCQIWGNFDGGTDETQTAKFTNPAGANGNIVPLTLTGSKNGLTAGAHFFTLKAAAITGGTCSFDPSTTVVLKIPQ